MSNSIFHFAVDKSDDRIFGEVISSDIEAAFDAIVKVHPTGQVHIGRSADDLADTLFCTDNNV